MENRETIRLREITLRGNHSTTGGTTESATGSANDLFGVERDQVISLVRLGQVLQIPGSSESPLSIQNAARGENSHEYIHVVLAYAEGRRVNVRLDAATMRPAPWTDHAREIAAPLIRA